MEKTKEIFRAMFAIFLILLQFLPIIFLAYVELYGWAIVLCVFILYHQKLEIVNLKKETKNLKKENELNLMWMKNADEWMHSMTNAHQENIKWINDVSRKHNTLVVLHQDLHQRIFPNSHQVHQKMDKPN